VIEHGGEENKTDDGKDSRCQRRAAKENEARVFGNKCKDTQKPLTEGRRMGEVIVRKRPAAKKENEMKISDEKIWSKKKTSGPQAEIKKKRWLCQRKRKETRTSPEQEGSSGGLSTGGGGMDGYLFPSREKG